MFFTGMKLGRRSQWPRGLRRRSAAARPLRSWVRIPPGAWRFVCCECCVLSGRGFCDELITRPEESYRMWCVVVCDLEKPCEWGGHDPLGAVAPNKKKMKFGFSHRERNIGWGCSKIGYWESHLALREQGNVLERRGSYRVLVGKPEERDHLEEVGVDGIILKWIFKKWGGGAWPD